MKSCAQLIAELRNLNVRLFEEDGQLRYHAPKGVLSEAHRAEMRARKAELLDFCRQARVVASELPLEPASRDGALPIALAQQRLWLLEQIEGPNPAYNIALALRLLGRLDIAAFQAALTTLLERHESLRSAFQAHQEGTSVRLVIADSVPLPWTSTDVSFHPSPVDEARRQARDEARRPFDLTQAPLVRFRLWHLAGSDHVFLVNLHHIISDGSSIEIFAQELAALYAENSGGPKAVLPKLDIQYADFAWNQRRWQDSHLFKPQLDYWRRQLKGLPSLLELPTDRQRPPHLTFDGAIVRDILEPALVERLRLLAREQKTTLFVTLSGVIAAFLARHTGREDIPIACPASQRNRAELAPLIGFFINTLVLRIDVSGNPSFLELLTRARAVAADGFAHQDVPFDKVVEALGVERNPSYPPLAQFCVSLLDADNTVPQLSGLETESFDFNNPIARYDLTLEMYERRGALELFWCYNTHLFDECTVQRMADHFHTLTKSILEEPNLPVASLKMMDDAERRQVLYGWNATDAEYPGERCIHELFEAQVLKTPSAVAVAWEGGPLDYAELNRSANRLARHLRSLGVGPDARVAICAERGVGMVVGLLAILKAGGAYVPLDPTYPRDRLNYMLADCVPAALLVESGLTTLFLDTVLTQGLDTLPVIHLDIEHNAWERQPDTNLDRQETGLTSDDLAYVIYTSGSTGNPKGAMNAHRGVVNRLNWMQRAYGLGPDDTVLQKTPFSFDVSVWEFFWPLLTGSRLFMARPEGHKDPTYLSAVIDRERITTLHFVPPMLHAFLEHFQEHDALSRCNSLRRVICSGEALPSALAEKFHRQFPGVELHNLYGPTEAAVDVTAWECRPNVSTTRIPIGRPIDNTHIYILDPHKEPVPVGVTGEIFIGGVQVGRGYLGRIELTAERFVKDPFVDEHGARMYCTGDLGRWLPEGVVEYLGRNDFQVKIRGFRIELGEIESALQQHPAVRDAAVLAREHSGTRQLVAYLTVADGKVPNGKGTSEAWQDTDPNSATLASVLTAYLRTRLPDYMVPAAYVLLDAFPLSPNGKLDRGALPAPGFDAYAAQKYETPRGETETALADLWASLLNREQIGRHDNFFALGGDSILSIQLASRASQSGLRLTPGQLFEHQTIATLAQAILNAKPESLQMDWGMEREKEHSQLPSLEALRAEVIRHGTLGLTHAEPTQLEDVYPLTPLQQGLLFHSLHSPDAGLYCISQSLDVHGLDTGAFRHAWQTVLERHSALRTAFAWERLQQPLQIVQRHADLRWTELDWRDLTAAEQGHRWQEVVDADRRRTFALDQAPLLRITLARVGENDHRLLWTYHHLLLDGWSWSLVVKDLLHSYRAVRRGITPTFEPCPPFRHYLEWLHRQDLTPVEAYWREALRGQTEPTPLPFLPVTPGETVNAAYCKEQGLSLDAELSSALRTLAQQCEVPLNTVVQAAFAMLLSRYSAESTVVFGFTTSGRPADLAGVESMVGLFINTLPLRIELPPLMSFRTWLKTVQQRQVEALQNGVVSLAQIQSWSEVGGGIRLFDALYVFENHPITQVIEHDAAGFQIDQLRSFDWTNYPLTLAVIPDERLRFILLHDTRWFSEESSRRLLANLRQLLESMKEDADQPIHRLSLLTGAQRQRALVEWNQTYRPYPRDLTVPELFDAIAAQTPAATAISWDGQRISYEQLQHRANRIAHLLNGLGITSGSLVALHLHRSAELVALMLGILKAGAVYVPLDTAYPVERLALMLKDSGAKLLLTERGLATELDAGSVPIVWVDDIDALLRDLPPTAPPLALSSQQLAYVIYTSGSTGTPKGVAVPHRAIVRLVKNTDFAQLGPEDRVAQASNTSFDAATFEIWGALLNGGTVVGVERDVTLSPWRMADFLRQERISTLFLTTALFNQIARNVPDAFQSLTHLLFGGEAVDPSAVAAILNGGRPRRLLHVYGPTENTTFSTWHLVDDVLLDPTRVPGNHGLSNHGLSNHGLSNHVLSSTVPIGKPIANSTLYLLDQYGAPVPVGVPGQLYVGGDGLAQGYWNQARLTEERFVPDPFSRQSGAKLYRTGDIGRYLADGSVEFIGRADNQVKIRGFRVELGEIEAALMTHPTVGDAVVTYETRRLTAYVVPAADARAVTQALKVHLALTLPEYMIPSDFVTLESFPLNANGKVDRRRLPKPELEASQELEARPAKTPTLTPTEEIIAGIWSTVLGRVGVQADANFFELGGHSLLATQVISRLREAFGVELPLSRVFQTPTVAGLARAVEAVRGQPGSALEAINRIDRNGQLALSFAQERLWFLDQLEPGNPFYNVPLAIRLHGTLDITALENAFEKLAARHEVLRTRFPSVEGIPTQIIANSVALSLPITDLSSGDTAEQAKSSAHLMYEEARTPFDLSEGPLLRLRLLRLTPDDHILLFTMHHIIADGWSLGVLVNELVPLYALEHNIEHNIEHSIEPSADVSSIPLPELPIQYADFAAWQRRWLVGPVLETQLAYWKQQLFGVPPTLDLPTDRPRPPKQSYNGSSVHFQINSDVTLAFQRLCRDQGVTLFMSLLAAFAALLHRCSGSDDLVIGSPIANRNRIEIEPLVGFFVNTLAMRIDLTGNPRFVELLRRVRKTALDAYAHQDLPFEKLVDEFQVERDISLNPLFQVMFALQNAPLKHLELPGLEAELLPNKHTAALFDLVLDMWETDSGLAGSLEYNSDLFDESTAQRIVCNFSTLLDSIAANPETPLEDLTWLTKVEGDALLQIGTGPRRDYPVDQTLHALFERTAAQCPTKIAATHRGTSITYAELNARADLIAQHLRHNSVDVGDFIGIFDERGVDVLAAMLGILKAGAAFVPFDADYPIERVQGMLADSCVKVLISRGARLATLPTGTFTGYCLNLDDHTGSNKSTAPAAPDTTAPDTTVPAATGTDLAYMLYTSGSTGTPKGAMLRHDGAVNHIFAQFDLLNFHADSAFLQSAPSSSDISVWQFLAPVLIGGRTVIADYEVVCDPVALLRLLQSERISLIELVPVVLRGLLDHANQLSAEDRALPDLEIAMVTGEAVTPALVNLWLKTYPHIKLANAYGPTEAADDISQAVLDQPLPPDRRTVPIGQPLPNLCLYVLDKNLRLVPIGVPGEICVSGIGVGAGYFGRPVQTRESFVPNPFADDGRGDVLYRTGDLGRWLSDGNLECLERIDHQVKLRGFRIELGEIESVLSAHPAVREAAVGIREDLAGEKQLLAYVVPDTEAADVRALTETLQRQQVELWQDLHEDSYRDELQLGDETFNVIGWDSNYTNLPLSEAEMREYVGFTVDRIASLKPGRVLEIGCGTALIMFPLLQHCQSYTGTDLSQVTIRRLEKLRQSPKLQSRFPGLAEARLLHKRADDCEWMECGAFDTVVFASVVQYFPGIDYLLSVLDGIFGRALAKGGALFLGDIRSLPLLEVFAASVQRYKSSDDDLISRVAEKTRLQLAQEQEMAIDPGFFLALRHRYPQIRQVQILPKRGFHHNEMTRFRYDVLIRTDAQASATDIPWMDWREYSPGLEDLRRLLDRRPAVLALQRIQNQRVYREKTAAEWLLRGRRYTTLGELQSALAELPERGLEPEEVLKLGDDAGYQVDLSLAAGYGDGSFDAVFRPKGESLPPAPLPPGIDTEPRPWRRYANNPLHEKLSRKLTPLLREFLRQELPNYMVPTHFTLLSAMPLNPAGKIDRMALPTPVLAERSSGHAHIAPRTKEEQVLATIWIDVLGLQQVGIHDNFFELGGHSLKATQVTSRIHSELDVQLPLREIFNHPTIAELAEWVQNASVQTYEAIPKAPDAPDYPLSHAQRRVWVLSHMEGGSVAYNMPLALELEGHLDVAALQGALECIVDRHESLRTAFIMVNDQPRQWIAPQLEVKLACVDLRSVDLRSWAHTPAEMEEGLETALRPPDSAADIGSDETHPEAIARRLALEDAETPFDLTQAGLFRASLLTLAEDRHVLLFNMHHIISDGWSMDVLVREFTRSYTALARGEVPDLPPLTVQYRDYACWRNAYLQSKSAVTARDYWHQKLSGTLPRLNIATDLPRPPVKTYRGRTLGIQFDSQHLSQLAALGRAHHASLFMVLTAIIKTLLYRYTGQTDILIGFPIAGRDHAQLENQIGFYVNTLPLRDMLVGDASFTELLAQVKATATEAYGHQAYPIDQLVDELEVARDVSRSPMFDVVVVMQTGDEGGGVADLKIRPFIQDYESSKFDLAFTFEERHSGLQVDITYNSDLFIPSRIQLLAGHIRALVESVLADTSTPIHQLNMLAEGERQKVLGAAPHVYSPEATLVGLFEAQVAKTPHNIALVFPETSAEISPTEAGERQTLSYAELNARANRLAHQLIKHGIGPETLVAMCLPRKLDLAIGLLAILKAGAAYLPLDPTHPPERRAFMVKDASPTLLLTRADMGLEWPGVSVPVIHLDLDAADIAQESEKNLSPDLKPDALAYVIYTSGSTGMPKGVAVTHHNVVRLFKATDALYQFGETDVWTLFHSTAFDFSVWELWGALLYGGRVVIVPYWVSRSPQAFHRLLAHERVTVLNQTPSAFRQLVQADADAPPDEDLRMRYVIFGGEALDLHALKPWFERHGDQPTQLVNMYGITETTVHVTYRPISVADLEAPGSLIGKPLADLCLYILDPGQKPTPVGVTGELYVGGAGVARGYLNRPGLTAERFISDPFGGGRLYRTGDLARFLPDGDIEYLGRIDQQVQIRGFRVEPGEIEAALCQHEAVRDAVVVANDDGETTRLLAYLTPAEIPSASVLRHHLSGLVPDYMIPTGFIGLEQFPLTPNGKLDRAALPKPASQPLHSDVTFVPAEAGIEKVVADVFMQVLQLSRVGLYDNFFELGANSLLLMQVHRTLQKTLNQDFPVVLLFQYPTVATLAAHLEDRSDIPPSDEIQSIQDRVARRKSAQLRRKK